MAWRQRVGRAAFLCALTTAAWPGLLEGAAPKRQPSSKAAQQAAPAVNLAERARPVPPGDHPPGVLIDQGAAHATIVTPCDPGPAERYAAADLQQVFYEMTSVALPIAADSETVHGNRMLIGATRFTDAVVAPQERAALGPEAYIARRRGRDLALAGGGPYGVIYAAAELYDRLGARWLMPGELGACIPRLQTIRFDTLDVRGAPSFAMRFVSTDAQWSLRNRLNRVAAPELRPAFAVYPSIFHSQSRLIPFEEYGPTRPEFFALRQGERRWQSRSAKLCNSNGDLPKEIARNMVRMLRENAGVDLISLSPSDGKGYCECEECRRLDEPDVPGDQSQSRRQMILYNRVAEELEKEFPQQRILVGAYHDYTWPPKDPTIRAHRNLAVVICHSTDYCQAHAVSDPACPLNRRYVELIRAWQQQTPDVFFYEYYYKERWYGLPWPIVHNLARDIPFYESIGVKGLYTQHSRLCCWGNFLAHYVAARLLWDPTTDVAALLEEFYAKFYGAAAAPMKRWHEALEEQMASATQHFPGNLLESGQWIFTPPLVEKLRGCVEEARRLADDGLVERRLERMAALTEYTARFAEYFQLREKAQKLQGKERRAALSEALRFAEALHEDTLKPIPPYEGIVPGARDAANLRLPHSQLAAEIRQMKAELAGKAKTPAALNAK